MTQHHHGARVRILPLDIEIDVEESETLMQAGLRSGLRWPTICGGAGTCTVCYVVVDEGLEAASEQADWERERLEFAGRRGPRFRLACQLQVSGPMTVVKRGMKAPVSSGS